MKKIISNICRIAAVAVAGVLIVLSATVTFGENPGFKAVPTWNEIFSAVGLGGNTDETYVAVADVGNADCILLYSRGYCAVIDTGDVGDNGQTVVKFLKSRNIKTVDALFITHPHSDHIGGLSAVLENFTVKTAVLPDMTGAEGNFSEEQLSTALAASGTQRVTPTEGLEFTVGEIKLSVLMYLHSAKEENDRSVIIAAEADGVNILFMGDATQVAEAELLDRYPELQADILKVGHHGSGTSGSEDFIKTVSPKYAAISCGTYYSDVPNSKVIKRLTDVGASIKRTDINSDITYYIENGGVRVETKR